MLSASSRHFRCHRAAELFKPPLGPDPFPIRIQKSPPLPDPNNRPSFTTVTSSINHTHPSSESQQQTLVTQILSTIENAPTLLQSLHNKRIFLTPKSFNRVLISAAQRNHLYLVTQIFKLAIASKIQPLNSDCYLTVAKAFARADDCVVELLSFTEQVLELTQPSMTVINRLLFALGQCKETDNAILIFTQVKDRNFTPDMYTYNTVLEILGRAGRTGEMLGVFGEMKEAGIDPDLVSYNTVINHVRKFGEVDMCLLYFKEMCEMGVQPDLLTYTAVIDGLGRSGDIEESLKLFGEMKERRIWPSLYLYRAVISNLKKMGKVEMAASFMEEMNSCASSLRASRKSNKCE
ncbi:putative pentatricopeptide [Rosa chinensis]|uniref:Putative pentatricopeptide n=1 Tax=Rosa chinensis TaxID=74649 RepID=A0A2P6SE30_ROSCH|nr:pentatricopeptide repeat-containing protein At1g11900 [Rosa chinensis]XP_040373684.1 pentatricopeptide repeat-containing protein At1g11900 [Rosa chinensis]PRQ56936.1 putative pentatricopeptide [Rosa chinensis]